MPRKQPISPRDRGTRRLALATGWLPLSVLLLFFAVGCQRADESRTAAVEPDAELSAVDVLKQVRKAYQAAPSYADQGEFVLRYQLEGQQRQEKHPFQLAYRRPHEFHLRVFNASLIGDGEQMAFAVNDPPTNHMDQQVVIRPAPEALSLPPIEDDPIVAYFSAGGAEIPLTREVQKAHIELAHPALVLFSQSPQAAWFGGAQSAARLPDKPIDGRPCYRIRIKSEYGAYVAWVDAESWLIRRLEYPLELLDEELSQAPQVAQLEMYAELRGAEFAPELPKDAFAYQLPKEAHPVRNFVSLPEPFPSELIGKRPGNFELPVLGQAAWNRDNLDDHLTAMLWFSGDPVCAPIVRQFGQVREQLSSIPELQLIAVSTDPATQTSDVQLLRQVRQWGCDELVGRANQTVGLGVFDVRALPTVVVTNQQGVVQFFRTVENGELLQELLGVLKRLERGEDVADEMRAEYQRYLDQYAAQLKGADPFRPAPSTMDSQERFAAVSAASLPNDLELDLQWVNSDFQAAGNIVAVGGVTPPQYAVLDGFRTVVTLDPAGKQLERQTLDVPDGAAVTALLPVPEQSSAATSAEARFLGGSVLAQQWFAFDQGWQRIGAFPAEVPSPSHAGIRDVWVEPADESWQVLFAYWQEFGLQQFDSNGTLRQRRAIPQVNSVVQTQDELGRKSFWVASNDGVLREFTADLVPGESRALDELLITHLFDADAVASSASQVASERKADEAYVLGMAVGANNTTRLVGLNESLERQWDIAVSAETFTHEVRFATFGEIADGTTGRFVPCWLIARPDGRMHVISTDGSWQTEFTVGFSPTGLALARVDGKTAVLVAGAGGVACWQVKRLPQVSQRNDASRDTR